MTQPPLEPDRLWEAPASTHLNGPAAPTPSKPPVSNLLLFKVLASSVLAALFLLGALIRFYGKDQREVSLANTLLAPQVWQQLSFSENSQELRGKRTAYFTDKILLRLNSLPPRAIEITQDEYRDLYDLMSRDEAVLVVTEALERRFEAADSVCTLLLMVRPQERAGTAGPSIIYQQVEFLHDGSYYRTSVRRDGVSSWKYFRQQKPAAQYLDHLVHPAT